MKIGDRRQKRRSLSREASRSEHLNMKTGVGRPNTSSLSSIFPEREAVEGNRIEVSIRLEFCQALVNVKLLTFNIEH